ncbi:MAG TPA: DUF5666 domain-containing protein [Rhizobacter sp.]|jgi:hypothetical protein|nr:DUF5666 domain-containing protein [Rhizobacter sp.]
MKISSDVWRALMAWLMLMLIGFLAGQLAGCGGVDSGGTGQTVQSMQAESVGRISGFGSVIVNGVRFDDTQASVTDDEGVLHLRTDLQLGMVVEIAGEVHGNSGTGVARNIQFHSEIAGPVQSINLQSGRLVVLGQAVQIDADTLISGYANGLASVAVGDLLEVFAFYDPNSAVYAATRIERKTTLASFKLRGRLSGLDNSSFFIGGARIDYSAIAPSALPQLANGLAVRVSLQTVPVAGRWVATTVRAAQNSIPDATEAEVEGYVAGFVSSANFVVSGVLVDASGPGVRFQHGSVNQLANGVRAEVKGEMRNGVLVASEVDLKQQGGGNQEFELHGAVESVNAAAQTFVLRGVAVAYDAKTNFTSGSATQLVVGAQIEVRGVPVAGSASLLAQKIKFEH